MLRNESGVFDERLSFAMDSSIHNSYDSRNTNRAELNRLKRRHRYEELLTTMIENPQNPDMQPDQQELLRPSESQT